MKTYTEEKRIRPDILTAAVYWSVIIMMVYNVISVRIFGDKGTGFCAGVLSLYYLLYVSFVLAVQKSVYVMVRLRARRSQFINAERNMVRSLRIIVLIGVILAVLIGLTSFVVAEKVFGSARIYFQLIIVAVSLIFLCPQGVYRGYLQGLGYTKPIVISDLIVSITSFISGGIISAIMYSYGKKVNNLFHGDEYSAIYGASGMMIGLLIGSIAGFIQVFISVQLRKREIKAIINDGAPRYLDNKNDVLTGIRQLIFLYASPLLMCVLDNILYNFAQIKNENTEKMVETLGAYSGRVIYLVILISFLSCIPFIKSWNRVMARIERDEFEGARERYKKLIHFSLMFLIPVSICYLVSSDILQEAVFGKKSALLNGEFTLGALMIFVMSIAIFVSWLLSHMGKSLLIDVNMTISWIVHIVLVIVFLYAMNLKTMGIALAQTIAVCIYDILSLLLIFKMLKIKTDILRNISMPVISAGIAGLVFFAEQKLFINLIGEILTLIIGLIVFTVIYMIIIIVLKGVRTHELEKNSFGRLFVGFSSSVQRDKFYEE